MSKLERAASVLSWVSGLGFGLACLYALGYFAERGRGWSFLESAPPFRSDL